MLIIVHRGASAVAAENTLPAFTEALKVHADAIELDIYQVDGELYVFHDRYLARLTAQQGRFEDLTQFQVQRLLVKDQHPIPTLEAVLQLIAGRCALNIELKSKVDYTYFFGLLARAIDRFGFQEDDFLISSFNHHWLHDIKRKRPQTRIGALTSSCPLSYAAFASELQAYSVNIDLAIINQDFVDDAHRRGLKVYVFTVDDQSDIAWLKKMGVDGIFTNHPQASKQVLASILN